MTREDAKAILKDCLYKAEYKHGAYGIALEMAIKALEQEPKTGHWIDEFGGCECSECGCLEGGYSNYCPNCGAKMTEIPTGCSTCILDNTDACTRGAGRAVDDEACEEYLGAESEKE